MGLGRMPETDEMFRITPPLSWFCITGYTAWLNAMGAIRFRATIFSLNRGDTVADSAGGAPPALLMRVSTRPVRSTAAATTPAICSGSRTSAATNTASRPSAITGSSGGRRAQTTTSAPAARNRAAIPRPSPLVPPVMMAVLPVKSRSSIAASVPYAGCRGHDHAEGGGSAGVGRVTGAGYRRPMVDKRMTEDEVVAELKDGMTIGIGGWGSRRKPMSLVRAILRSDLKDLTVVAYGGPDIGLLCAAGKLRRAVYGFVSLDSIPLEPHFRQARQSGAIEFTELDEGAFYLGLLAAAHRVPFYPTRAGLGSDMLTMNPELRTVTSPYDDGEELVAIPAFKLDAALIHMNRADAAGNGQFLGPDLYFDDLFAMAADRTYLSTEKIVPTENLLDEGPVHTLRIQRIFTDGVVEAPQGAHFTECPPDYGRDEAFQREYAATARDPEAWAAFKSTYLDAPSHADYLDALEARS